MKSTELSFSLPDFDTNKIIQAVPLNANGLFYLILIKRNGSDYRVYRTVEERDEHIRKIAGEQKSKVH